MKIKDINRVPKHMTTIGGQALIEGIMMRGPKDVAIAVRKPNGEIVVKNEELNTLGMRYKFFALPFIRGVVGLIESMLLGINSLMYSAEFFEEEIEEEEEKEYFLEKVFKDKADTVEIIITLALSLLLTIGLFILLPSFFTNLFKNKVESPFVFNIIEGLIRISIFLIYVIAISKMDDVDRVFEYHGAEHKTIHCYENGDELTVENVKKYPILHPRCGTSFLFMVMIVSIFVLSFFGWPNPLQRFLIRILMLPIIAGISYEINRLIGKSNSAFAYYLSYPGLFLQKIATVKEPDEGQIETAIIALEAVITDNKEEDLWK
ncbi:MAG: DUF1385 domain-containing protein [Tissierellia bacterium]|nr:DUF1385 domain-containing protein [Tissierellia bacterium]